MQVNHFTRISSLFNLAAFLNFKKTLLFFLAIVISFSVFSQVNYTWIGNNNTNWNDQENWNPNTGFPTDLDHAIFNNAGATFFPVLDADRDISQITFTAGTLDLNGFSLNITGDVAQIISVGSVNNGNVNIISNAVVTMNLGTHSANFSVVATTPTITNSVFNGTVYFEKTGAANNNCGGNTFNSDTHFKNSQTGNNHWGFGHTNPDIFNAPLTLTTDGLGNLHIGRIAPNTQLNANITYNNISGNIRIGNGGGTSLLADGVSLIKGTCNAGTLEIRNIVQLGTNNLDVNVDNTTLLILNGNLFLGEVTTNTQQTAITLTNNTFKNKLFVSTTNSGNITLASNILEEDVEVNTNNNDGNLVVNAGNIFHKKLSFTGAGATLRQSTFEGEVVIDKFRNQQNGSFGGNVFKSKVTITNHSTAAIIFSNDVSVSDVFESEIELNTLNTGTIRLSERGNSNQYFGNIVVNISGGNVRFGQSGGESIFNDDVEISTLTGITSGGVLLGSVYQTNATPINLSYSGTAVFDFTNCHILGDVVIDGAAGAGAINFGAGNIFEGNVTVNARGFTLRESTFNSELSLTKIGITNNDSYGGNVFNGPTTIVKNSAANIRFSNTQKDIFNNTLSLLNNATSELTVARVGIDNEFNGDVIISSNGGGNINIGGGGGSAILGNGAKIIIDPVYNNGTLSINKVSQTDATNIAILLNAASALVVNSCEFLGELSLSTESGAITLTNNVFGGKTIINQPELVASSTIGGDGTGNIFLDEFEFSGRIANLRENTFHGAVNYIKTNTGNTTSPGGNVFKNTLSIAHNSSNNLIFGNVLPDEFEGDVTLELSGDANAQINLANTAVGNIFKGDLKLKSSSGTRISLGQSNGTSIFQNGAKISILDSFDAGQVYLGNISQTNSDNLSLSVSLASTIRIVNADIFGELSLSSINGNITIENSQFDNEVNINQTGTGISDIGIAGQGNVFQQNFAYSGRGFRLAENTFKGLCTLTKTGATNYISRGGNTFENILTINHNGAAQIIMAGEAGFPDIYQNDVFLNLLGGTGTSNILMAHTALNNQFLGDIYVESTVGVGVGFGQGGGTANLEPTKDLTVGAGGFSTGALRMRGLQSSNPADFNIVLTGNATFAMEENSVFNRNVEVTAPIINISGGTINGNAFFTRASNNNSNISQTSTQTFTCNGNFSLSNLSTGSITLGTDADFEIKGNIDFSGSAINGGIITLNSGTGKLILSGNTPQTITGRGNIISRGNLELNNAAGAILSSGNFIITNQMNFVTGILNSTTISSATNERLIFENSAIALGTSDASHVIGYVEKIGNQGFEFPTGNGLSYSPISITAPSDANDRFAAAYFGSDGTQAFGDNFEHGELKNISQQEYWMLDKVSGSSSVGVALSWHTPFSGDINDIDDLTVVKWNGDEWVNVGAVSHSGNVGSGSVTSELVAAFSPFTLASTASQTVLPIQLLSFQLEKKNRSVFVKWATAQEINSDYFVVEKSVDLKSWTRVGDLKSVGNSNVVNHYEMEDEAPFVGMSYYRLQQIDFDGKYEYFTPLSIYIDKTEEIFFVDLYPNPTKNGQSRISSSKNIDHIELFDTNGKMVLNQNNSSTNLLLNTSDLNKGIYLIKIYSDQEVIVKKLVVE
jgi:hypothetical protein